MCRSDGLLSNLRSITFSDSIIITGEPRSVWTVLWAASHLQRELLEVGVPTRGGIAQGRTVHTDGIIYGEGLLEAYHLESTTAVYPRIVISPPLSAGLDARYKDAFLRQDADGLWFIDPFGLGLIPGDAEEMAAEGYDPYEEGLNMLGSRIDTELSRLSDASHIAKWNWLKHQQAIATQDIRNHREPRFSRFLREAKQRRRSAGNPDNPE